MCKQGAGLETNALPTALYTVIFTHRPLTTADWPSYASDLTSTSCPLPFAVSFCSDTRDYDGDVLFNWFFNGVAD